MALFSRLLFGFAVLVLVLATFAYDDVDQLTEADTDQDGEDPSKMDDERLRGKSEHVRSRMKRDGGSQLPSSFDHNAPFYSGQCFMCPPGPRGPPGVDGRDGRDGRDRSIEPPVTPNPSPGPDRPTTGKTYIRWGKTTCREGASLVYEGVMGGKHYAQKGSGTNYLCLHNTPVFDNPLAGRQSRGGLIYGTEAEPAFGHIPTLAEETEVPCGVCLATEKRDVLMIPGVNRCPTEQGWREEYHGYIAAMRYNYFATQFICLDHEAEGLPGTARDDDPSLLHPVEAACSGASGVGGGLPCPPYVDGYEVTCVVCSI